jgi:nucleoside-diphosphate-sugar epimerase
MRYLVTGGAGFIGSHLVGHLVGAGHDVVVLDDLSSGKRDNVAPWLKRITFIEASITDPAACARAVTGADYVLHQAAVPSVPRSVADPVGCHAANATGTLNVLVAARDAKVKRVVYAASSSAYGDTPVLPKREEMLPRPRSPYAAAKLAGEDYCKAFHASYGLETVSLRYFNVFGPRQDPASEYAAVVPRFITAALDGEPPVIFGDGEQTRDFTYVENVVLANLAACTAPPAIVGGCVNIGCGERVSINALWRRIAMLTGTRVKPRHEPARAGDVRDSLASVEQARDWLGWTPTIGLEEGLERTLAAHRAARGTTR